MYPKVFEQAKALTSLDGKPLVVVTATESIDKTQGVEPTCRTASPRCRPTASTESPTQRTAG